ncbi:hypothetical protein CRG98_018397 [Punica granatum]|uniref:Retrovirus-related Pol polyprotein from transposon TNT 1-94-like beta-barrel domain-containing protein n=1 Tax=Punica granatum TaxID=22663 RepID=A0A2I0K0G6_PUNGR|nr:hypothetical protein CRG98_018397 [Punica granatum]
MSMQSPMEIWKALEEKCNTERQATDKFLMMKYFEFKILDSVPIMDQVHELQILVSRLRDLKVIIPESLQVGAIISKLPSSWNDYRKKLLHIAEDFTVEKILRHLRIEEETRKRDAVYLPQVAMVTGGIESLEIGMITELNIAMIDKFYNWWLDSGVTVHVCAYGNHQSVKVLGQGTVELNFTSGKKLTLINVLHVPDVRKNLLSASLLCNKGFKFILESDKLVLFKGDMYLGKGYCSEGMFKLSIVMN